MTLYGQIHGQKIQDIMCIIMIIKYYDTRVKRSRNPMQACLQEDF